MILDDDFRILVLDHLCELAEECRLTDTSHILQTDFLSTCSDELIGNVHVVLQSVNRRVGDAKCALRSHAAFLSPLDARNNITNVVQTVEDTCDVCTLLCLHLVHEGANVVRYGIHTQSVKTTVEHVCLNASLVERLTESAYRIVWILACEKVHLLESATVCLNTGKATHIDNHGSNALQLVFAWLELARRLPHISINETELDFLFHLY